MIARILTPWTGDGLTLATSRRPQLVADHPLPTGASCSDVTGQPAANLLPSPNLLTVEVTGVDQSWLNAVAADGTYSILWSE